MGFMDNLTWRCDVCGDERPDMFISVFKRDLQFPGLPPGTATQNIKYCNDRTACREGASTAKLMKRQAP